MGEIEHLLNSVISLEAWTGSYNDYGKPTFSAPVDIKARRFEKVKMTRDIEGRETVSTAQIFCEVSTITTNDRITLPDGTKPLIISVSNVDGFSGYHHTEIYT